MKRRIPGLTADDCRTLASSFRATAKEARKLGDSIKAERFERKAADYEERARLWDEKRTPRPR